MRRKISVVGCGTVAVGAALRLAEYSPFDVVLYDASGGLVDGRLADLESSGVIRGRHLRISESSDPETTADSDILVLTHDPEAPVDDVLGRFRAAVTAVAPYSVDPVLVVVSDGAKPLCDIAQRVSGVQPSRVIGTGTLPDSARLSVLISRELGIPGELVDALAIGVSGKSAVPLIRFSAVSGIPVLELIEVGRVDHIVKRFRRPFLKRGRSRPGWNGGYSEVAAVERIISAVGLGTVDLIPCEVWMTGQHDLSDVFLSVPSVIGPDGVERIVELDLTVDELVPLRALASAARERARSADTDRPRTRRSQG